MEAAATLQGLAEALSARIADLDGRVALIEETPAGMKIILTKDIQLGKKGDTVSVSQPRGDYLIRMGVAKLHVAKRKLKENEEKTLKMINQELLLKSKGKSKH